MKTDIRQRIAELIQVITVTEIVSKTDLKKANLYRVKGLENFGIEILEKIIEAYPNISSEWLIYGIGEMWKNSIKSETTEGSPPSETTEGGILEQLQRQVGDLSRRLSEIEKKNTEK